MRFGLSRKRLSPIALDFGADSLKLLQISQEYPPRIEAAASAVVPEEARHDPGLRQAFLQEQLPTLLKSHPFRGRKAICSLPAFQMLVQHLEIPQVEPAHANFQVGMQLRERLNVDPDRMVVRHVPLAQATRAGQKVQDVLCLAAPYDVVMRYLQVAERSRLDVVGMHSEPMALLRAFQQGGEPHPNDNQATALIDIGAATTKVVITQGGAIVFGKTIQAGGDTITRQVARLRSVDFFDARHQRFEAGGGELPTETDALEPARAGTGLATLDAQMETGGGATTATADPETDTIECLVDELQMCLRYHQRMSPQGPVKRLIFFGGEATHAHMCMQIARSVRVAAQRGAPLEGFALPADPDACSALAQNQSHPGWAVPLGLCISEANL